MQQPPHGYGPPSQGYGYPPPPSQGYPAQWPGQPQMQQHGPRCQSCGYVGAPMHASKISTGGWIMFVVLLIFCFPLCFIPLLTMKDRAPKCARCHILMGGFA